MSTTTRCFTDLDEVLKEKRALIGKALKKSEVRRTLILQSFERVGRGIMNVYMPIIFRLCTGSEEPFHNF